MTLSQQEIDAYFEPADKKGAAATQKSVTFDFRRLDRIAKSQLGIIHFLHETFIRSLASSLSLYLRSYVSGNLISVEQMPFAEFVDSFASPTCTVYLTMQPYDGHTLIEINHSLLAPILDHVLGGKGKIKTVLDREITDVEEAMLEEFFRIIAHDLREAWKVIVPIRFEFDSLERKPVLSNRIASNEAVVTIAMELRVGEAAGMINLAIPSITLKTLHLMSDQQRVMRKTNNRDGEYAAARRLADKISLDVDLALLGATITLQNLAELAVGKVLDLGLKYDNRGSVLVNGIPKFVGEFAVVDSRRACVIESCEVPQSTDGQSLP